MQTMQTINMIQSVLQIQQNTPIESDALEIQARYHRTAAGNFNVPKQKFVDYDAKFLHDHI